MAKVTPENFVRVETNRNFKIYGGMVGGTNRFWHKRDFGESNASGEFYFLGRPFSTTFGHIGANNPI